MIKVCLLHSIELNEKSLKTCPLKKKKKLFKKIFQKEVVTN